MRKIALILLLALGACEEPRSEAYSPEQEVDFTPVSVALAPAQGAQRIDGIATLVSPDPLTQLDAEIRAAEIASAFSQRTVARFKGTSSLGEHRLDNAERQAAIDATQVALLELRLRNAWGDTAPFLAAENRLRLVDELSSGKTTLVRIDFPRSVDRNPQNVRITPLGGGEEIAVEKVWPAPSGNLAMPGTSFFGIMPTGPSLKPGDRAKARAERSTPASGVIVPADAVVVHAGASWCYVETGPDAFERKPISLATPVETGYLTNDFAVGTKVVVKGASALLAREAEPGSFDDDDDDDGPRTTRRRPDDTDGAAGPHAAPIASSDPDPD